MGPRRVLDTKTYWLTDRQSQYDFDLDFDSDFSCVVLPSWQLPEHRSWRISIGESSYQATTGEDYTRLMLNVCCSDLKSV
jgi:hypothetical protein